MAQTSLNCISKETLNHIQAWTLDLLDNIRSWLNQEFIGFWLEKCSNTFSIILKPKNETLGIILKKNKKISEGVIVAFENKVYKLQSLY